MKVRRVVNLWEGRAFWGAGNVLSIWVMVQYSLLYNNLLSCTFMLHVFLQCACHCS